MSSLQISEEQWLGGMGHSFIHWVTYEIVELCIWHWDIMIREVICPLSLLGESRTCAAKQNGHNVQAKLVHRGAVNEHLEQQLIWKPETEPWGVRTQLWLCSSSGPVSVRGYSSALKKWVILQRCAYTRACDTPMRGGATVSGGHSVL